MESVTVDLGALSGLEKTVGFLMSLAASIALMWVVEHRQRIVPKREFSEARNIALVATAVCVGLIFVFFADSDGLPMLGYIASGCVLGCLVFYLWNLLLRTGEKTSVRIISYVGTLVVYITCGNVSLVAAVLAIYVYQQNPANQGSNHAEAAFDVVAEVTGERTITQVGVPTEFRVSSGQVNFGCEQRVRTSAQWSLPPDSTLQGEVSARWMNVANAKSYEVVPVVWPDRVEAVGTIQGLDFQRMNLVFGSMANCPGGGHGEIVLSGTYTPRTTGTEAVRKVLRGQLSKSPQARSLRLTLPGDDIQLKSAEIRLTRDGDAVDSLLLPLDDPGPHVSAKEFFSASLDAGQFIVALQ